MSAKKQEFDITGMHCAACVKRVENVVSKVDGVASVKVNLLTRKGSVEFKDGSTVQPQQSLMPLQILALVLRKQMKPRKK